MIYLCEGAPGSGKTTQLIRLIQEYVDSRDIYILNLDISEKFIEKYPKVCNITAKINWKIPENIKLVTQEQNRAFPVIDATVNNGTIKYPSIRNWVKDGSILLIDEAQFFFPAKSRLATNQACNFLRSLEFHRHFGLDIYFFTQRANLLDTHIRHVANYHIIINKPFGLFSKISWYESYDSKNNTHKPFKAERKGLKNKEVFALFNSASVIHKPKSLFPRWVLILLIFFVIIIFAAYYSLKNITSSLQEKNNEPIISENKNDKISENKDLENKNILIKKKYRNNFFYIDDFLLIGMARFGDYQSSRFLQKIYDDDNSFIKCKYHTDFFWIERGYQVRYFRRAVMIFNKENIYHLKLNIHDFEFGCSEDKS